MNTPKAGNKKANKTQTGEGNTETVVAQTGSLASDGDKKDAKGDPNKEKKAEPGQKKLIKEKPKGGE